MKAGSTGGIVGFNLVESPEETDDTVMGELLLGPTGGGEVLINLFVFLFFFLIFCIPFISYAFVSGGMQWIIVLVILSFLALYMAVVMRRGLLPRESAKSAEKGEDFTGELSRLTDSVRRGSDGYAYSQQMIKEHVAEAIMHKIRLGRGIDEKEMKRVLEENDVELVGDEDIMRFIQENKRSADGWSDRVSSKKKGGKDGGAAFLREVDDILEKAEVWN